MKGLAVFAILLIAGTLALGAQCLVQCATPAPPCHQHSPTPSGCEHLLAPQAAPGVQIDWQFVAPAQAWAPQDLGPLPQPFSGEAPLPAFASSGGFTVLRI